MTTIRSLLIIRTNRTICLQKFVGEFIYFRTGQPECSVRFGCQNSSLHHNVTFLVYRYNKNSESCRFYYNTNMYLYTYHIKLIYFGPLNFTDQISLCTSSLSIYNIICVPAWNKVYIISILDFCFIRNLFFLFIKYFCI